jgi:hypothetical protein
VILHNNEIQVKLSDLAFKALIPSAAHNKPIIYPSCPADPKNNIAPQTHPVSCHFHKNRGEDQGGDKLILGLWAHGTDYIIDIHISDVDAKSNCSKDPAVKVLSMHKREKKKKYLEAYASSNVDTLHRLWFPLRGWPSWQRSQNPAEEDLGLLAKK